MSKNISTRHPRKLQEIVNITVIKERFVTLYKSENRKVMQKERRVDALALRADERRDKLRKALGSCK